MCSGPQHQVAHWWGHKPLRSSTAHRFGPRYCFYLRCMAWHSFVAGYNAYAGNDGTPTNQRSGGAAERRCWTPMLSLRSILTSIQLPNPPHLKSHSDFQLVYQSKLVSLDPKIATRKLGEITSGARCVKTFSPTKRDRKSITTLNTGKRRSTAREIWSRSGGSSWKKLFHRNIGPFQIMRKLGPITYEVEDIPSRQTATRWRVFNAHVSQLNRYCTKQGTESESSSQSSGMESDTSLSSSSSETSSSDDSSSDEESSSGEESSSSWSLPLPSAASYSSSS
jgi:hypothetical protein